MFAEQQHEGLQVAMGHAAVMGECQAAQGIDEKGRGLLGTENLRLQPFGQRVGAFGVVKHEGPVFAYADFHCLGQVRMLQPGGTTNGPVPAPQCLGIGRLYARQQQQTFTPVRRIANVEDAPGHAALALAGE